MKAAHITQTGSPERIKFDTLPKPRPTDSQVLVRVEAVSVNPIDTYIRSGAIKLDLPMPYIVGCDLAGVVEAVGPTAKRFSSGDRVWGSNQGLMGRQGTFAEFAAVDECWLYPTPDEVSSEDAAAVALVGITAHLGLFRDAGIKPSDRVFVSGGSGGVGSCVVQMAKIAGAKVATTAGNAAKAQICKQLGANMVIAYKTDDIDEALDRFGPIDIWFETLREQNFDRIVKHMAMRGRIVVMAGREARPAFPVGPFYVKDLTMHGFAMFNAPASEQRKCAAEINRWLARGRLKARIDRVMPLKDAAKAHKLQEQNTLKNAGTLAGKIVLTP
jgi:NADPH2:quinone reductase